MKQFTTYIDRWLNSLTMYRLVVYGLSILLILALGFSIVHILPQSALGILLNTTVLIIVCYVANKSLALLRDANANYESWLITALILALIISPIPGVHHLFLVALSGLLAIGLKFSLTLHKHHLFNPAACSVLMLGILGWLPATWWVGNPSLCIFALIIGLLILRKIRKFQVFGIFLVITLSMSIIIGIGQHETLEYILKTVFLSSPLIFFGTIMLTEPETMPSSHLQQTVYALIAGVLLNAQLRFGPISTTPEMALIIANVYSVITDPKRTILLHIQSITEIGPKIFEAIFQASEPLHFEAGQYMYLNMTHAHPDDRGTRRTFSIASAPGSREVHIAFKVPLQGQTSSFKEQLLQLNKAKALSISSISGTFTLPSNVQKKLVFMAGGIGITPFLSMVKHVIQTEEKRDITILYFVGSSQEVCFKDVREQATPFGIRVLPIYPDGVEPSAVMHGVIDGTDLEAAMSDYISRDYFISGPPGFVDTYAAMLTKATVPRSHIHTDHFAGY